MNEILFAAHWTAQNAHLQTQLSTIIHSPYQTTLEKIHLCFKRALTSALGALLSPLRSCTRNAILPISDYSRFKTDVEWLERWDTPFKQAYEPVILQMISPDGSLIKGVFYKHRGSLQVDIPTIVCFNPNQALAKSTEWEWLLKKGAESAQPFHVIVFDYRDKPLQADELLIDGETVVQTALNGLGISPTNLHFFGFSLGGAISALIADIHPGTGRVVNRSSFMSLDKVIQHSPNIHQMVHRSLVSLAPKPIVSMIWNRATKWIATMLTNSLGWNLDASQALRRLKDRLLVVYHPQDRLIPPAIGAIAANGTASQTLELTFKPTVICDSSSFDYHLAPLKLFENATRRVLNFIMGNDIFLPRT